MSVWLVRKVGIGLFVLAVISCVPPAVHAETTQSTNFRFDESALDAGGLIDSSSSSFRARSALGDTAVGEAASGNFQTQPGSVTTNDPALSFAVNSSSANFGSFSPSAAATATASFSVLNYTSYGYVVNIAGNAPTNGAHTIAAMSTTDTSQVGQEQFGMNLVANTSPISFGANPVQGLFGVGTATANYNTSDQFRYVSGEAIATATKSSGLTTYTISYIVNVGSLTPGGQYSSNQTIIVTGTY
ncbi:MAG TPA: hypothetical protein VLA88_03995 [Candidatus Saccharimonadales bacterium]|nr:hypothetical protein [Candidatus Saccharimonadales bacterium]